MCGIAGIFSISDLKVSIDDLKKMTDVIAHRGPDGEGHWVNSAAKVGFGHRRLSIIDLSENGKQPMHYKDERYTITFNGEIYNYIELREQLKSNGYSFSSDSDTEVLMALYDLKKEKCLDDLDGMFSFAIWDEMEQVLFCARDRFGEKPFHYYKDKNRFIFGSEIKQFWKLGIEKRISRPKLLKYVENGVVENPEDTESSFYDGILKLRPAHFLKIERGGVMTTQNYWKIDSGRAEFNGTIEEAASRFLELFTESVRVRLRSDVPVGSSLSGGLDSSSIVMLIDLLKGKELQQNTFSARFKNFAKDEGKYIEEVVKTCRNVKVHYTWPDEDYLAEVIEKVCWHQDEPFASASIVAQYAVMQLAKQHDVTVLLDGQGADEQMAGYLPYYSMYLDQLKFSDNKLFHEEKKMYSHFHGNTFPYRSSTETETVRMKLGRYRRKLFRQDYFFASLLKNRLIQDTTINGLSELLRYADRNSMAHSREVRLPFLNHKLVEFIFSLPSHFLLNGGWTKFILRKAMTSILPQSICWRVDKIGYEPPQRDWLKGERYSEQIKNAALELDIQLHPESKSIPNDYNWRLLMASAYL